MVVGTEATRRAIADHVHSSAIDLQVLEQRRQYVASDAGQALAAVMSGDRPDAARLAEIVDGLERSRLEAANESPSRVIVFGEMAVPLCSTGNMEGALEIEQIWSRLTARLPIFTTCSYPLACFQDGRGQEHLSRFYAEHQAICHAPTS